MLGESLLVAPVFSHEGSVEYYLPAGRWTNFLSGEILEGPRWIQASHDMLSLPLMVRPNSVIAVGHNDHRPDYDFGDGVTLQVFELEHGAHTSVVIPSISGEVDMAFEIKREGRSITVEQRGASKRWQLLLVGIPSIGSVDAGISEHTPKGLLITPTYGSSHLIVSL